MARSPSGSPQWHPTRWRMMPVREALQPTWGVLRAADADRVTGVRSPIHRRRGASRLPMQLPRGQGHRRGYPHPSPWHPPIPIPGSRRNAGNRPPGPVDPGRRFPMPMGRRQTRASAFIPARRGRRIRRRVRRRGRRFPLPLVSLRSRRREQARAPFRTSPTQPPPVCIPIFPFPSISRRSAS